LRYQDTTVQFTDEQSDAAQLAQAVGCQRDEAARVLAARGLLAAALHLDPDVRLGLDA
jgi:hypothetical protein